MNLVYHGNISSIKPYNYQTKNDINEIRNQKNKSQISNLSSLFKNKINKKKNYQKNIKNIMFGRIKFPY